MVQTCPGALGLLQQRVPCLHRPRPTCPVSLLPDVHGPSPGGTSTEGPACGSCVSDVDVLKVERVQLIDAVLNLCTYHHPENIQLPPG